MIWRRSTVAIRVNGVKCRCSRSPSPHHRRRESGRGAGDRNCAGTLCRTMSTRKVWGPCASVNGSWGSTAGWSCERKRGTCAATLPSAKCDGRPASAIGRNLYRNRRIWTASLSNGCNYKRKEKKTIKDSSPVAGRHINFSLLYLGWWDISLRKVEWRSFVFVFFFLFQEEQVPPF